MTWVAALLIVGALATISWLAFGHFNDRRAEQEAARRRTAEERLRAQQARNVRRIDRDKDDR